MASRTGLGWDARKNPAKLAYSRDRLNSARTSLQLSSLLVNPGAANTLGTAGATNAPPSATPVRTRKSRRNIPHLPFQLAGKTVDPIRCHPALGSGSSAALG